MTPPMTPREKVALKPCPFCGSDAILEHDTDHHGGWFNLGCGAPWSADDACPGYHAFYTCDPSEQAASIAAWNRRASLASSGDHAELARLADKMRSGKFTQGDRIRVATLSEALLAENAALRAACSKSNDEISQTLGKALGYPWFKDDQINFPGATAENGVCVGDHVAESLADEAARRITEAERKLAEAVGLVKRSIELMTDDYADTKSYRVDASTFLNREAERG